MGLLQNELLFAKITPDAIIPSKRDEDAGMDIYACFEEDYMIVPAHETRLIPTGIASALNEKYYIQLEERGSTGSKGIKKSAGVIDSGYRDEWFVAITNANNEDLIISKLYKEDLINNALVDDEGDYYLLYNNNRIFINYSDDNSCNTIIYPYSKAIAQAVVHEIPKMIVTEIDYEDLLKIKSERGIGSLGSSSK